MSNVFCGPTMAAAGVRTAALGGRGLFLWQRQCAPTISAKGSMMPVSFPSKLPGLHFPAEAANGVSLSRGGERRPFLRRLHCSLQQLVLLSTKEFADGSIEYKFGTADQRVADSAAQQLSSEEIGGVINLSEESKDGQELKGTNGTISALDIHQKLEERSETQGNKNKMALVEEAVVKEAESVGRELAIEEGLGNLIVGENIKEGEAAGVVPNGQASSGRELAIEDGCGGSTEKLDSNGTSAKPPAGDATTFSGTGVKEERPDKGKIVSVNAAAAMIPHPDKAKTGGEDAYFIEGTHWLGISDGVGGWILSGVNAGHYARELMWNCAELARKGEAITDPKSVLVKSAEKTKAKGTATALVASIYDETLRVANIGDSGFVVVRGAAIVARSEPMVRGFNFPYQIGTSGDEPGSAQVYKFQISKDDVVVLGTDGIFDNLFDGQIVAIVSAVRKVGGGPEVTAKELVKLAQKIGSMKQGLSPFAVAAHGAGYQYNGGKLDDTTAVVAYIT